MQMPFLTTWVNRLLHSAVRGGTGGQTNRRTDATKYIISRFAADKKRKLAYQFWKIVDIDKIFPPAVP